MDAGAATKVLCITKLILVLSQLLCLTCASLPPRPQILSPASALKFHGELHNHARRTERAAGHVHKSALTPRSSCTRTGGSATSIDPTAFGADPTASTDSTDAFEAAIAALLNSTSGSGATMASGIADLGGRTLDLVGGEYLLSAPIVIPPMYGNIHVRGGTLRAAEGFPRDRWLLEVGNSSTCSPKLPDGKVDKQASCNENIGISDVLFDASHRAAGGARIGKTMGATFIATFFIGFTEVGLRIDAGHEVMVAESWLAACYWSNSAPCSASSKHSIGIQINGNDHYLANVIVFDYVGTGVEVNGAANVLNTVHTWNGGGVGISLGSDAAGAYGAHQNRLIGCYLDYNTLLMFDPTSVVVESTFFLSTHAVIRAVKGVVDGLIMRYNTYTASESVVLDGEFVKATNVIISDEINAVRTTRTRGTLSLENSTRFEFDFADALLFPNVGVEEVLYSVVCSSSSVAFFQHFAHRPNATGVVVLTSIPVTATVTVEVRQAL